MEGGYGDGSWNGIATLQGGKIHMGSVHMSIIYNFSRFCRVECTNAEDKVGDGFGCLRAGSRV